MTKNNHNQSEAIKDGYEFEKSIVDKINRNSSLRCVRGKKVRGQSGNTWRLDGTIYKDGNPFGFLEVKRVGPKSSWATHMKLAYALMGDFQHLSVPKAVVVPHRPREFGKWAAYLNSIGCWLIEEERLLTDFVDEIQDFPVDERFEKKQDFSISNRYEPEKCHSDSTTTSMPKAEHEKSEKVDRLMEVWDDIVVEDS